MKMLKTSENCVHIYLDAYLTGPQLKMLIPSLKCRPHYLTGTLMNSEDILDKRRDTESPKDKILPFLSKRKICHGLKRVSVGHKMLPWRKLKNLLTQFKLLLLILFWLSRLNLLLFCN